MKLSLILPLVAAAAVLPIAITMAQPPSPPDAASPPTPTKPVLTLSLAEQAVASAAQYAGAHGAGGAIAVVDDGGYLVCLHRLDGTFPASAAVATAKARTAAIFRKNTQEFENAIKNGRVSLTSVGEMLPLEGGVPIVIDGQVVGAVGVSGAKSSTQDVEVATVGAHTISSPTP